MKRSATWLLASAVALLWLAALAVHLGLQETPTGWLAGRAVAEETGQPLPRASIRLHLLVPPSDEVQQDFLLTTRADGTFRSGRLPAGPYQLEASSRAHRLRATTLLLDEGARREVTLELEPIGPLLDLRVQQHVFTPDEIPQVIAHGFLPDQSLALTLYRVDGSALFRQHEGNLATMVHSEEPPQHLLLEGNPGLALSQRLSAPVTTRDVEGVFHQRLDLPARQPGIYLVVAEASGLRALEWVMVTRLGLVLKQSPDQALAYVVDLKTGTPVPDAAVELSVLEGPTVAGTTDADGIFQARLPDSAEPITLLARAEKDGSEAFLTDYVWRENGEGQDRVYLYTDRPVYRPGHRVSFKGIARRFAETRYTVPANEPLELEVWDPRDTLVYRAKLITNDHGSYHGQLDLNEEAATGQYRVVSTLAGLPHESYFSVAEYRKPEYSVNVTMEKKRYTRGEPIRVEAAAQYYFGAPVAGADVTYTVRRSSSWFSPFYQDIEEEEGFEEGYGGYGEVIASGSAKTDDKGVAAFSVSTRPSYQARWTAGEEAPQDYLYTIEVTVTDPSRKSVTDSASAPVTQGAFALSAQPRSYIVSPGETTEIELAAMDYDRRPVAGVKLIATAGPQTWHGPEVNFETEARAQVSSGRDGKAVFRLKPLAQGHYRIQVEARDDRGNRIQTSAYLWVTAQEYGEFGGVYPKLEIVADKDVYRKGETATLLINSDRKGATALLTVEGARLYQHRLVQLKGKSTRVEVPIQPEYAPNFFVSVAFVQNKEFVSQEKRIKVSVEERRLQVTIKPDKPRYTPGERVTYDLRTTDWQGRPVPAELSLGVVDESVYAIQKESAPPILGSFYPPRWNRVSTSYSFPSIYLDANKEALSIKVRKRFPDTAYWNPTFLTGPDGRATLSFAMPDTLTTWRATVRGATLDTAVGEAVSTVKCTKDLLVRLEGPRFFVQQDRVTVAALVHNYTRSPQRVKVWIKAPGLSLSGGDRAATPHAFTLEPDGVTRQEWEITVPGPGPKEVTVYVRADSGLSDAMALTLPALPHGRERMEWRTGAVVSRVEERLVVRSDAVPGASDVRLRLAPSLASVMLGALDYLAQYPYGCTEQTMSAFLPDVVVAKVLRELGITNAPLEERLPKMVQKGLDRLYGFQHEDGGWGWWRYDQSDPWMTAYVVYGLTIAKRNGFFVNDYPLNQGLEWLARDLQPVGQVPNLPALSAERLYLLHVLALAGKESIADPQLTEFYRNLDSLDSYRLALLTSTLLERGRRAEARVAAERLWVTARHTQSVVSWPGREGWGRGGDAEVTALAFQALFSLDPEDQRLFNVVRWFVLNREGNHWVSTRDTAFALLALTDFLKRSHELQPDYTASLTLNGAPFLERRFTSANLFDPEVEISLPADALRQGDNLLDITKTGPGNLYYTIILRQFVGQEEITKLITGSGISVQRDYYPMLTQRDRRTGVITTSPSAKPTTGFRSGQPILVRLTINSPREYEYVVVEDPLPAGCEVMDRGALEPWEWDRWWSDMDVRDEKVAVFARRLPAGASTIEYHLRPQIPGQYHTMPTQAYSMYNPELRGSGAETRVSIR